MKLDGTADDIIEVVAQPPQPENCSASGKGRKLLRFSPKLLKRKSEKGAHGVTMASNNEGHVPNGLDRERLEMKQAFDMFDKNNDGKISCEELGCVLRTLGHEYTQVEVEDMIKHADTNENGYVEYDEFLVLMKKWSTKGVEATVAETSNEDEDKTKETFKVFDIDGNGYIDQHELRYIMKRLGENLEEEDVKEMFQLADLNGDGLIDYEEFQKLLGGLEGGLKCARGKQAPPSSSTSSSTSSTASSKQTPKSSKSTSKDGKKK